MSEGFMVSTRGGAFMVAVMDYGLCLFGLLRASYPSPFGPALRLFKIAPGDFVRPSLALHLGRFPLNHNYSYAPEAGHPLLHCTVLAPFEARPVHPCTCVRGSYPAAHPAAPAYP